MTKKRKPTAFDVLAEKEPTTSNAEKAAARPAKSMDVDDKFITVTTDENDIFNNELEIISDIDEPEAPVKLQKSKFSLGKLASAALFALLSLSFGLWVETLITDLFARSAVTGWIGTAALITLLLSLLILIGRELMGIARLQSVEKLRQDIIDALPSPSVSQSRKLVTRITNVVSDSPSTARGRQRLKELDNEIIDGDNLLALAETKLFEGLDKEARKLILTSAKRVSVVTAISPKALIDTGFALYEMVRLTRKLATLYGARPGLFGSIRLIRSVVSHLAVTGTIAVGESLLQQFVSHGIAGKISARFGEGVINGIMTTRFGIVAMELSRPMPFNQLQKPQIKNFLSELAALDRSKDEKK